MLDRATPARLKPALDLDLSTDTKSKQVKGDTAKLLIRMPEWLKPLIQESADAENISMNLWVTRILAEATKAGTISQPYAMEPRKYRPTPEPEPTPTPIATKKTAWGGGPVVNPFPGIQQPYTITYGTNSTTEFVMPDADIPDL